MTECSTRYVAIGGGIAAVSCVEQLAFLDPKSEITLVSASKVIKAASNVQQIGKAMEQFDVIETSSQSLFGTKPNINLISDYCVKINPGKKEVYTKGGKVLRYEKLCLAMGGKPKLITQNKCVIGIRDTESVIEFQKRLAGSRRIIIIGNGGIASELIYELKNVEIIWAVKHASILAAFVDPGAAHFLISHINEVHSDKKSDAVSKRMKYSVSGEKMVQSSSDTPGSALGPDWVNDLEACGSADVSIFNPLKRRLSRLSFVQN